MIDKKFEPVNLTWWLVLAVVLLIVTAVKTYASEDECRGHSCNDGDIIDVDVDVRNYGDEITVEGDELLVEGDEINVAPETNVAISRERQAPNIYLNAGQAERDCGKVIGLSGSNTSGGWALGVPWPRKWAPTCDFWLASNEAQQNGHIWLSYHFQCQISHIAKAWGDEQCDEIERKAWAELGIMQDDTTSNIILTPDEYQELTAQAVQKDEYQEQQELVEYRYMKQQSLIDSLQQEAAADDDKIEALEQRIEDEVKEADARRAAVRAKIAAKQQEAADGPESPDD